MSWVFVLRPREMEWFRRCRRAWDLRARVRQNYVPVAPSRVFDFDKAIHDALAVYYFPAMDDWNRAIVRPLALQGFQRSMRQDHDMYQKSVSLTLEQEQQWAAFVELGQSVLTNYFEWALTVDNSASIFSDQDVWAPIPDPCNPGFDLAMPDGRTMRYLGRIDQLVSDRNDEYWVVDHRVVEHDWTDTDEFLLDVVGLSHVWALELAYPQLKIAGTIYNELRTHPNGGPIEDQRQESKKHDKWPMRGARHLNVRRSPSSQISHAQNVFDRTEIVKQEGNAQFRRTHIRRSRASIEDMGIQVGMQALDMRRTELQVYPSPSADNCLTCEYREPCIALTAGFDPAPILAARYRKRTEEESEEESLRWSSSRTGTRASFGGRVTRPDTQ